MPAHSNRSAIVSVLRATGLYPAARALYRMVVPEPDHGHGMLLKLLAEKIKVNPDALRGQWLVEIGSTREDLPGQGSTAKIAEFCARHGLNFVTVDMDPENTARAEATVKRYDPNFQAVNSKGEDYLATARHPVDICYLDAFDIDHGQHSQTRHDKYAKHLGVSITDEACWKMHYDCALALSDNSLVKREVVFDDTWEVDGRWTGKGSTAIPYMLDHGFTVSEVHGHVVGLRRG